MRKLGKTQEAVLNAVREHGFWHSRCGWVWTTDLFTLRTLRGLVRRGDVIETVRDGRPYFEPKPYTLMDALTYGVKQGRRRDAE